MVFLELCKIRIAAMTTLTALVGFVMAKGHLASAWLPIAGTFLLACGSAALNQYQEQEIDAYMNRTRKRPLPAARILPGIALAFAMILVISGAWLLLLTKFSCLLLGAFLLFWYNGVYTHLKRKTMWAAIPGGVIGALPPILGWIAAGADIYNRQILMLALFFFIWQIPHFWLIILLHEGDYERANLPALTQKFSRQQLAKLVFVWILATIVVALLIPAPHIIQLLLASGAIWLMQISWHMVNKHCFIYIRRAFVGINLYALLVLTLFSVDTLYKGTI